MTCCAAPPEGGYVPLEDFLPYVLPHVIGVPDEVAAHAIRVAAIDLASYSNVLKREIAIDTLENVGDYTVDLEEGYVGVRVRRASLFGSPLSGLTALPREGDRAGFYYAPPGEFFVHPAPSRTECRGIEFTMVVTPGQDTCYLDRMLYDHYAEGIGFGAVARLAGMPGGAWYNLVVADRAERKFMVAKANAKANANRAFTAGPLMMKSRRFV